MPFGKWQIKWCQIMITDGKTVVAFWEQDGKVFIIIE